METGHRHPSLIYFEYMHTREDDFGIVKISKENHRPPPFWGSSRSLLEAFISCSEMGSYPMFCSSALGNSMVAMAVLSMASPSKVL